MTSCALPKTEPTGDDLQSTALRSADDDDDEDDDDDQFSDDHNSSGKKQRAKKTIHNYSFLLFINFSMRHYYILNFYTEYLINC